jgi:hypothetical protein
MEDAQLRQIVAAMRQRTAASSSIASTAAGLRVSRRPPRRWRKPAPSGQAQAFGDVLRGMRPARVGGTLVLGVRSARGRRFFGVFASKRKNAPKPLGSCGLAERAPVL